MSSLFKISGKLINTKEKRNIERRRGAKVPFIEHHCIMNKLLSLQAPWSVQALIFEHFLTSSTIHTITVQATITDWNKQNKISLYKQVLLSTIVVNW